MVPLYKTIPRRGRWSLGEVQKLKELYGTRTDSSIARSLGRSVESVRQMAEKIFEGPTRSGEWDGEEKAVFRKCYGVVSVDVIARRLRRDPKDVWEEIRRRKTSMKTGPWSANDVLFLKQIFGSRSDDDLSLIFCRPVADVGKEAERLRLSKDKGFLRKQRGKSGRMPRWDAKDETSLRELYPSHSNLEIAKILSRSVKSVVSKAHDLGLKKGSQRLQSMGRENVAQRRDR